LDEVVCVCAIPGETKGKTTEEFRLADEELVEFKGAHDKSIVCLTFEPKD